MAAQLKTTRSNNELNYRAAVDEIQKAVDRGLPSAETPQYDYVAVMAMRWSNDDSGAMPLEMRLSTLLQPRYGFGVNHYVIDNRPSTRKIAQEVTDALMTFRKWHQGLKSLLIYVYSSNAESGSGVGESLVVSITFITVVSVLIQTSGSTDGPRPRLDWNKNCEYIQDTALGDTLYLFDCPYTNTAAIEETESKYLAAASPKTVASDGLHNIR